MLDNPSGEEIFPYVQFKPSLVQLEAVPLVMLLISGEKRLIPILLSGSCRVTRFTLFLLSPGQTPSAIP